jgi:hypothetical protein
LLFLGDRYGWQPLPVSIPADEWDVLIAHVNDRELLNQWYQRDDNAVPPAYILQPRDETVDWYPIEDKLREIIQDAVRQTNFTLDQCIKYETSATEQEIHEGMFNYPHAHESAVTIIRKINGLPESKNDYYEDDDDAQAKLITLRERLQEYTPHHLTAQYVDGQLDEAYIKAFCDQVETALLEMIDAELAKQEERTLLEQEISQHEAFLHARSQNFIGRDDVLAHIETYLQSNEAQPLVLHGQSGVGKTSIMAQVVQKHPQALYRFIGATPTSSDIQRLLTSICEEINERTGQETEIPFEYTKLTQAFPKFLAQASADKPLLIVIDSLDQLSSQNNPASLTWFPTQLPPHVQMIVVLSYLAWSSSFCSLFSKKERQKLLLF